MYFSKAALGFCLLLSISFQGRLAATFDEQDFSIGNLVTEFQDVDNAFSLQLNYTVGGSVSKLGMTLFYVNCTIPYVDRNMQTMVIEIGELGMPMSDDISMKKINIFKENFSVSPLVTKQKGNSVGVLDFCVKVEGLMDDDQSVTFQKDNIKLSYDLSKNVFTVNGNKIRENNVTVSTTEVTTSYGVDACRCNGIDFDLRCEDNSSVKQDTLFYICIQPTKSSINATNISDLTMRFEQDNEVKFTAVEYGFKTNRLSEITKSGQTLRVVSRLVTALFEGTGDSFNVTGNAYLSFKTETRRLATMHTSDLRLVEETPQEDIAGEASFKMDVKLEKETVLATAETKDRTTITVSVLGGFIFLSAIFVLVKKTRRQES